MPRDLDILLYGATGFTGRQTVAYFQKHAPPGLRWAIAGRNQAKLEALDAKVPIFTADSSNQSAIDEMVGRTRIVLNTAGPFALYGTPLVDACVRLQTHYCDITGETHWIRMLIDRYHEKASADGTRIIPCCGFDSVPSDLGAMLIAQTLGPETSEVKAFFQMQGGLNGGTLASILNIYESGANKSVSDLFLLSPSSTRAPRPLELDPTSAAYDPDRNTWTAPFVMSKINTRVVRRSSAIAGFDFAYQEYTKVHSHFLASMLTQGGAVFERAMNSATLRNLLRKILPAPGEGPSKRTMDKGWFHCELYGRTSTGQTAQAVISDQGDPGNRVTTKCICESALALAQDELPTRAGILTPATGIGAALVTRLRATGMKITTA